MSTSNNLKASLDRLVSATGTDEDRNGDRSRPGNRLRDHPHTVRQDAALVRSLGSGARALCTEACRHLGILILVGGIGAIGISFVRRQR